MFRIRNINQVKKCNYCIMCSYHSIRRFNYFCHLTHQKNRNYLNSPRYLYNISPDFRHANSRRIKSVKEKYKITRRQYLQWKFETTLIDQTKLVYPRANQQN